MREKIRKIIEVCKQVPRENGFLKTNEPIERVTTKIMTRDIS